nr:MAG TPA: LONG TAIL FIBER PROTEIN [Caudoviricetes sp.]
MSQEIGMIITDAGLAEIVNAEQSGTAPVVLSHIAFGSGQYIPDPKRTALEDEFKRFDAISGGAVGDNIIHLTTTDASLERYTVYEVGVFTESGTLFAVYSQSTPIIQKAAGAQAMIAIDIVLTNINPESVTVGDTTFALPPATTLIQGIVELATNEETIAGADASRAVTPAGLSARTATTGRRGIVELTTNAEASAGTDGERAVTPAALAASFLRNLTDTGFLKFPGQSNLILQWGKALIAQDGTTKVVFPTAFPNKSVFAGAFSLADVQPSFSVSTLNATSVNFKHSGNGGVNAAWFAIGY